MRIYVRTDEGKVIRIPLPLWILKLGTGKFAEKMVYKYVPEKDRQYVECFDFSQLRHAVNVLKEYKGLEIVHVDCKDGTKVSIKI